MKKNDPTYAYLMLPHNPVLARLRYELLCKEVFSSWSQVRRQKSKDKSFCTQGTNSLGKK